MADLPSESRDPKTLWARSAVAKERNRPVMQITWRPWVINSPFFCANKAACFNLYDAQIAYFPLFKGAFVRERHETCRLLRSKCPIEIIPCVVLGGGKEVWSDLIGWEKCERLTELMRTKRIDINRTMQTRASVTDQTFSFGCLYFMTFFFWSIVFPKQVNK